jgi:NarL family two-component system response regulator LiaR
MISDAHTNSRPRLIIADDDPVVRSSLSMLLGAAFEVVGVARDSDEAIELARESQPDAAIVDVDMPKGGGLRAVRGILDEAPDTAIVVLSGDESDAAVRELILAGAMSYQRKGVDRDLLAQSLNNSIRARADARVQPV